MRVAIASLLFNWPSSGGGIVHSAELGRFLGRDGCTVRHLYARYRGWNLGEVLANDGVDRKPIEFQDSSWSCDGIQRAFRTALDEFQPDAVIITDSWNSKPVLAEAARGCRTYLRLAAQECLCPLNNVRLLIGEGGRPLACAKHQLATPDACRGCVQANSGLSGWMHHQERQLVGYGTAEYDARLRRMFAEAEAVLVVNPAIAATVAPYAKAVKVIPSGFDPARFPWPWPEQSRAPGPARLFFAGLTQEYMKGFHVLQAACRKLWAKRQDFEVAATADPPAGPRDPFIRYIGWQSQEALPAKIREADMLIFPTVAEEALGRSAVEAMGMGRPVIASRIGGLPYTVTDEVTGFLFEPGNVDDLAEKIERLIDNPELRKSLGRAGRKKFEREYTWDVIIEKHYKPLFGMGSPQTSNHSPQGRNGHAVPSARDASVARIEPQLGADRRFAPSPGLSATLSPGGGEGRGGESHVKSNSFTPRFGEVEHFQLLGQMARFFGISPVDLERMQATYRQFHRQQQYAERFGEWKTLSVHEAFLLCVQLSLTQPPVVVQIGSEDGRATRRIVDLRTFLVQSFRVVCHDVEDRIVHVGPQEAERRTGDLTGRFRSEVLERFPAGLIFLDDHRYDLIREVITETLAFPGLWTLAIHDCAPGLCNPHMTPDRSAPVTSATGVWERHVLAEAFGIGDPLAEQLENLTSSTHRLRVFSTQHGLALIDSAVRQRVPEVKQHSPPLQV